MTDWIDLATRATRHYDKAVVKAELPLEWVLARYGVALEPSGDGRLIGRCPFHLDEHPSFAVFGEERLDRCGCWSCAFQGDLFDLVQQMRGVAFREAVQLSGGLLEEFRLDTAWQPSAGTAPRPKADPADLGAMASAAHDAAALDSSALRRCIDEKGWPFSLAYLRDEWWVGVTDEFTIFVPHFSVENGRVLCRGAKTRTPRSHLYAIGGSDLSELYGAWRDHGRPVVYLLEGESDTWTAAWFLEDRADVFGLPTGGNTPPKPEWIERMRGRHVVLAFDGDATGHSATRAWVAALRGTAADVRVAKMPDGKDVTMLADPLKVLLAPRGLPENHSPIFVNGTIYARLSNQGEVRLSNWVLQPHRELQVDDGSTAYEGLILPSATDVAILSEDMQSEVRLRDWAKRNGGVWMGTTREAQSLLESFQAEGPFLGHGYATSVIGWHDGNFVWPGGRYGQDYWRWVEADSGGIATVVKALNLNEGAWDRIALQHLLHLHRTDVMTPILAWMAVAPLRSLFDRFPPLGVTGTSGSGKTTLIEAVLTALGWKLEATITSTTRYGVSQLAAGTNGIPLWFDEYRHGANEDARLALEQVLRDAWLGQPSIRGGQSQANLSRLTATPTHAPLIVTGEDAFSETSHVERMALINLPRSGQNPDALSALRAANTDGLGRSYIEWLVDNYRAGTLPSLDVDTTTDRVQGNYAVLECGWQLLRMFSVEATGADLPPANWSLLHKTISDARARDPILEALMWGTRTRSRDDMPLVLRDGDDALVRLEELMIEVERSRQFRLPGGREAMRAYLVDAWNGVQDRSPVYGRVTRLPGAWARIA